ncbi:hypothetical protein [Kitasatospora sp. LaBMicrA B282]|uniref:hypothetical protein n=1 Tax=Kitasatospora sp. LaBMicrA B282 TaxID=3420949 RepID=UPI003D0B6D98
MTDPAANPEGDETFEPTADPASAAQLPQYEGVNVCRVAALSTMFEGHGEGGDGERVRELAEELGEIGFSSELSSGERRWPVGDPSGFLPAADRLPAADDRVGLWQELNATAQPQVATAFLCAVLGSRLERESAAAAAALWRRINDYPFPPRREVSEIWPGLPGAADMERWAGPGRVDFDPDVAEVEPVPWDPDRWTDVFGQVPRPAGDSTDLILDIHTLARMRLSLALRSPDAMTRSLAMAALLPAEPAAAAAPAPPAQSATTPAGAPPVSTMIHGTWGWKGDWWYPGGGFHTYILGGPRTNLYSRGAAFAWSGAYRAGHRRRAAVRFGDWASDLAPGGLETVFGHSYGGEVAARASLAGTTMNQLVLLSSPATAVVDTAAAFVPVVDIRLRLDPVLALARTRQRLTKRSNVRQVLLKWWRIDHGATHKEAVWLKEGITI